MSADAPGNVQTATETRAESVTTGSEAQGGRKNLVLAAMIFAVSMTFIDQTIVSIAAPDIQSELHLTNTGLQWVVNGYLLSLAAFFAFGGRLADTLGHRRMVTIGVVLFAGASALCGLAPKGGAAEAWLVIFRVLQGVGGAIMFPAALAIVVQTFPLRDRGKALAAFFGIAGGLTAIGPLLGGWLTQWTWRAIFWVNIPVALIALVLIFKSKPVTQYRRAPMDYLGVVLIASGVALSVFGFQQSTVWGWSNPGIGICIAAGVALLVVFYFVEKGRQSPLIQVNIFRSRPFTVQNLVLGVAMIAFVPIFFFASEYAQVSLNKSAGEASYYLLYFFIGFVVAAQIGGRMLDKSGAKEPVVLGCALAALGFALWSSKVTDLDLGSQTWYVILSGAGMGFMLGPASTDAVNRAPSLSYGEATGITQTIRNYSSSLGLAILGTILVTVFRNEATDSLVAQGEPHGAAVATAGQISQFQRGSAPGGKIPDFVRMDFAQATQVVLAVLAGVMALAAVIAFLGLQRGRQEEVVNG